tara:strand:- start:7014 stop:7337 length:324 start_codon:yes stop_codon:yes gene_type:complete
LKAFEILVEDKRVLEKRDEYGPSTKPYAKKKFKKSPNVQFRHKSVRSFRTTRTQESGEESWKVLEVKYHQELIRELHKKKHCRSTFVQKHYCSKAKGQGRVGRGFAH